MIGPFTILQDKEMILTRYKNYFDKLAIGSIATTEVLKGHFQAIHVYIRVLEYFYHLDSEQVDVDMTLVEDVYYELKKSIYLLDTKYYA